MLSTASILTEYDVGRNGHTCSGLQDEYIVTRKEKGSVLHKIIYPGSSIITKGVIKVDCSEF